MRILCLADDYPWPPRSGYHQRMDQLLGALTDEAAVDLFCAVRPGELNPDPPGCAVARWTACPVRDLRRGPTLALRTAVDDRPRRIAWRDWNAARRALAGWIRPPYDLIWCTHTDPYVGLLESAEVREALTGLGPAPPVVVDLVDLEDLALRSRRQVRHPTGSAGDRARGVARSGMDRLDEVRWRRMQRRVALRSSALVCSEADRARLAAPADVVPNGYHDPGPPPDLPAEPVLVMVGLFVYPPNQDAARWFAGEVLPLVQARVPRAQVRLIGRHGGALDDLRTVPGVSVLGEVADVTAELGRARGVVVPLRSGSGTRIKILEAFAHGVPVVSTAIGCEGIDAEPGRHLLVADEPERFAAECVRVLTDDALAMDLRAAARALFEARYRWSDIRPLVGAMVTALTH
ncbi:MAG TPA: glycosyltransferase family 4 protein [Acidimicrobiales bacterium]|nr:glycosyltransferase family 4 protein [Acidimicrobiales bacterium]